MAADPVTVPELVDANQLGERPMQCEGIGIEAGIDGILASAKYGERLRSVA